MLLHLFVPSFPLSPLSILRSVRVPCHHTFQANSIVTEAHIALSRPRNTYIPLSILVVRGDEYRQALLFWQSITNQDYVRGMTISVSGSRLSGRGSRRDACLSQSVAATQRQFGSWQMLASPELPTEHAHRLSFWDWL